MWELGLGINCLGLGGAQAVYRLPKRSTLFAGSKLLLFFFLLCGCLGLLLFPKGIWVTGVWGQIRCHMPLAFLPNNRFSLTQRIYDGDTFLPENLECFTMSSWFQYPVLCIDRWKNGDLGRLSALLKSLAMASISPVFIHHTAPQRCHLSLVQMAAVRRLPLLLIFATCSNQPPN